MTSLVQNPHTLQTKQPISSLYTLSVNYQCRSAIKTTHVRSKTSHFIVIMGIDGLSSRTPLYVCEYVCVCMCVCVCACACMCLQIMETQYRSCVTHQLTHYIWETQFKNIGSDFDIKTIPAKLDIFKAWYCLAGLHSQILSSTYTDSGGGFYSLTQFAINAHAHEFQKQPLQNGFLNTTSCRVSERDTNG